MVGCVKDVFGLVFGFSLEEVSCEVFAQVIGGA